MYRVRVFKMVGRQARQVHVKDKRMGADVEIKGPSF